MGEFKGGNTGEISQEWELTEPTYKGMIPPSTQNLKALGLQVFIFICCSTFSFLPNVNWYTPPRAEAFSTRVHYSWPLTCTVVHTLIRNTFAWNHHQEDFRYRVKLYSPRPQTNGSDTTCWENPRGKYRGDQQEWDKSQPTYKGMTPPLT